MSEAETRSPARATIDPTAPQMMAPEMAEPSSMEQTPDDRRTELVQRIWETLNGIRFLSAVGGALFLLYLFTLFLPQMPGQLEDDPAGAQRWILQMSESYGPLGNGFRALGLFTVISSPILQLLIILLALIILTRLGDYLANAWRLYQMPQQLHAKVSSVGTPIPVPAVQPVYRLRHAITADITELTQKIRNDLQKRFVVVERSTVEVPTGDLSIGETDAQALHADSGKAEDATGSDLSPDPKSTADSVVESRLLALGNSYFAFLRPILFFGLLLALITIWIIVLWGWTLNPDPLPPGTEYQSAAQRLVLRYELTDAQSAVASSAAATTAGETNSTSASPIAIDDGAVNASESVTEVVEAVTDSHSQPMLVATVGENSYRAPMNSAIRLNWGQTVIVSRAGPPALYLRTTSNEPQLSRLGQSQTMPSMGLLFPSPGSEESIVVAQALGLRIIRVPVQDGAQNNAQDEEQFLAEVYDANNVLIERVPIQNSLSTELTLEDPIDEQPITVEFIALPAMELEVAHRPAIWLLWPALLFFLIGVVGYARQSSFVLLQLAPWPIDRTVVIVQSDEEVEITLIQEQIEKSTQ